MHVGEPLKITKTPGRHGFPETVRPEQIPPRVKRLTASGPSRAIMNKALKESKPAFRGATAAGLAGAKSELCRRSFARFVRQAWSQLPHLADTALDWNWHHDALCLHLQTMAEDWARAKKDPTHADQIQKIRNLLVNIAPGTTKTLITLVFFPAWMWTRWPRWSVRCVSSNTRSISESSDYARQLVTSQWYRDSFVPVASEICMKHRGDCTTHCPDRLPAWARAHGLIDWTVRDDKNAVSDWGTTAGGFRRSTGLKAPITGEHTDWILCDDPHDAEQVNSVEERANVISKWDDAIYNRVNDGRVACRVIVMQRLRWDDLAGHIGDRDKLNPVETRSWCIFCIPSEYDPDIAASSPIGWRDPRTEPGELLDARRFPRAKLDEELGRLGPRGYAAQHQQRPDADTQTSFKIGWWSWYVRPDRAVPASWRRPEGAKTDPAKILGVNRRDGSLDVDWVCVTVDATGGSTAEGASAVGILVVAGKGGDRYVIDDCTPGPRTFLEQVDDIKAAVARAVHQTGKRSIRVLVEKKAYGGAALEVMEREVKQGDFGMVDGRPVAIHFEAYELKAGMGDKEQRGAGLEPDLFSGVIFLPEGASWLVPFLAEFRRFPAEPNDRVDSLVQAIERYRRGIGWAAAFTKNGR